MMSFITTSPPPEQVEEPITNGDFWPEISPGQIREKQRIDNTITPDRLRHALIEAIITVNESLAAWAALRIAEGSATLADVDADQIDDTSTNIHRYLRAVGCYAKASLSERYRDFDSTAAGNKKADQLENPIDDLRRDALWAINDIMGIGRTTVELI